MKIVIHHSRGLGIEIDGQKPEHGGWSVGETEHGMSCTEAIDSKKGVLIGEHRVLGIEYDALMEDVSQGTDPKTLTLITETKRITLPVTNIRCPGEGFEYWITAEEINASEP